MSDDLSGLNEFRPRPRCLALDYPVWATAPIQCRFKAGHEGAHVGYLGYPRVTWTFTADGNDGSAS
jgi:hypothetical protein